MTLIEFELTIDPGDHFMIPGKECTFKRWIAVEDLESVKFVHTRVTRCLFSSESDTFTAVRYGDMIFRLSYDLERSTWKARLRKTFTQGAHQSDYVKEFREKLVPEGWSSSW